MNWQTKVMCKRANPCQQDDDMFCKPYIKLKFSLQDFLLYGKYIYINFKLCSFIFKKLCVPVFGFDGQNQDTQVKM